MWFYLMQIILILRSIRTFAIKNLSRPSYQGFCLRWTIGWLISIIAYLLYHFQKSLLLFIWPYPLHLLIYFKKHMVKYIQPNDFKAVSLIS